MWLRPPGSEEGSSGITCAECVVRYEEALVPSLSFASHPPGVALVAGDEVTIEGKDWHWVVEPARQLHVTIGGELLHIGGVASRCSSASAAGSWRCSLRLPALPAGDHAVAAVSTQGGIA